MKENLPLFVIIGFFTIVGFLVGGLTGALITPILVGWLTYLIMMRFKYGKPYGIYKLAPFACKIYDEKGRLIGSFKGTDWTEVEEPIPLMTREKFEIRKYDVETKSFKESDEVIEVDYAQSFKNVLNFFLNEIIPPPEKNESNPAQPATQSAILKPTLETLIKQLGKDELKVKYKQMTYEEKVAIHELIKEIIATKLLMEYPPKVYKLASLSNGVFIYWFAQGEPAEYYSYMSKQSFKKWKTVPWRRGFPVVEMWGVELKEIRIIHDIELKCLLCMPIQDERYKRLKSLLLQKYTIIASALATYTKEILDALPYMAFFNLIQTERDRYLEEKEVYKEGLIKIYADIGSLSSWFFTAISLLSQVSGAISANPEIPEKIKKQLSALIPSMEEKKTMIEKIGEKVRQLTAEKVETQPKPPETLPSLERKEGE